MYRYITVLTSFGILLIFGVFGPAQADPKCFQFTWLGPRFGNDSIIENATCADATMLASGVPCVEPLVVSYDGSRPDVHYIWKNHPEASCVLNDDDVCAKFTYYFDGHVQNSTYFCTKAVDNLGNVIRSGCHQQVNGSSTSRVCFCRSIDGGVPCNNSIVPSINYLTITLITIAFILQFFVNK